MNYWWVTRPKRKLNSVPEILATFAEISLDQEWQGYRDTHLSLEEALEDAGLKRIGERRDRTGGGARTYKAWIESLGLIFTQWSTKQIKLTLAGEAIMKGDPPVEVLKHQVLKYQFPSAFSINPRINVSSRFRIRPFRFLLRLLSDSRIERYLTEEEIAKIIIVEADKETDACYNYIVRRIIEFRNYGDSCLDTDFSTKYRPSKSKGETKNPYRHLYDISNTIVNWIEYTQLAKRNDEGLLVILEDKREEVEAILAETLPFIDRPQDHEYFQRKFGVDPNHTKDTRNLLETKTITHIMIAEQKVKQAFIAESLHRPISKITPDLIDRITEQTGIEAKIVEDTLQKNYSRGAIGSFMVEYFEMAFKGRDEATEFELATAELFKSAFGLTTEHIGSKSLMPDVLVLSDQFKYIGIIDNKAYSSYSITNDHKNRMMYNYIPAYKKEQKYPLAFFSYIAGGFGTNIDSQIKEIVDSTNINGSAISVSNVINLVTNYQSKGYNHTKIKNIFSIDRQVLISDL